MSRLGESGGFPQVARIYARMLQGMRPGATRADITFTAFSESGVNWQAALFDKDGTTPAHGVWWSTDEAFVLIDGVSDSTQAGNFMRQYKSSILGPDQFPLNAAIQSQATVIGTHISSIPFGIKQAVTVAGYSMGGAIACVVLRNRLANAWLGLNPQVISIAAPRVSNINDCFDMRAQGPIFRWFCDDDPIPYCPPHPDESLAFAVYSGRFDSLQYSRFLHPGEGQQVDASGVVTFQMLPTAPSRLPTTDIVAWYFGFMTSSPPTHTLDAFVSRIPYSPGPNRPVRRPPDPGPEPVVAHTLHQRDAAERLVHNNIVTLQRRQDGVPVRIPELRIVRAKRLGKLWGVYFGDKLIAIRPGRVTARHIARSLNEVLDRLQNSAFVNADAIPQVFKEYLDQARDPAGGFIPPMNTELP
jgi:hypothetical protein